MCLCLCLCLCLGLCLGLGLCLVRSRTLLLNCSLCAILVSVFLIRWVIWGIGCSCSFIILGRILCLLSSASQM